MKAVPEWLWAPLAAALLALIIGATGIWAGLPWLFPSLDPTIFLQVHRPEQDAARPYPIIVGHAAGVVAAVVSVLLVGAGNAPSTDLALLESWTRFWCGWVSAVFLKIYLRLTARQAFFPQTPEALTDRPVFKCLFYLNHSISLSAELTPQGRSPCVSELWIQVSSAIGPLGKPDDLLGCSVMSIS